jgi:hypothetical protein
MNFLSPSANPTRYEEREIVNTDTKHTEIPAHNVAGNIYNKPIGKGIANSNTYKQRNKTAWK